MLEKGKLYRLKRDITSVNADFAFREGINVSKVDDSATLNLNALLSKLEGSRPMSFSLQKGGIVMFIESKDMADGYVAMQLLHEEKVVSVMVVRNLDIQFERLEPSESNSL